MQPLVEQHAAKLLEICGWKEHFINKLLKLDEDSLISIMKQQDPELLRVCGQEQKQVLSVKLITLGLETLIPLPIVEEAFENKEHDGQEPYEKLLGHSVAQDMTID